MDGVLPAVRGRVGEPVDQAEHAAGDQQHAGDVQPGPARDGCRCSSSAPPANATPAKIRFTYSVHRQDRYSVSAPPSSRPTAPPATAIAPKTPNALPRSFCSVNVVVSSDSADGTSSAANAPWQARAVTSMAKLTEAPPMADDAGEAGQPGQERHLAAEQVGQPAAEQQQAAERQGVGGDHPLPVHGREVQRPLRRRQRDVHHREVQDHHELRQADHAQDQPAPPSRALLMEVASDMRITTSSTVVTAPRAGAAVDRGVEGDGRQL